MPFGDMLTGNTGRQQTFALDRTPINAVSYPGLTPPGYRFGSGARGRWLFVQFLSRYYLAHTWIEIIALYLPVNQGTP